VRTLSGVLEQTLVMLLAGGQGQRLYPLTRDRSKPAVPFGGIYRIIDFTLSNCINSGLTRIYVLTQYKSYSLDRHLRLGWNIFATELGQYLFTVPPQLRTGASWYEGTADAIFQNVYTLQMERPSLVLILSGDHVYRMDYGRMIRFHLECGAGCTVGATEVAIEKAKGQLGVMEVDESYKIVGFHEKPEQPTALPGDPEVCLSNMGVYLFETDVLVRAVCEDARMHTSHDFGRDVIPSLLGNIDVCAYPFDREEGDPAYWRDIGTLHSYWEASMDIIDASPSLDLYDPSWPIRTHQRQFPPARVVAGEGEKKSRVRACLICPGCVIDGASVERSILSPGVRVEPEARVRESVIMDNTRIGRGAVIERTIVDKNVTIPDGCTIGIDADADRRRFVVTEEGIPVVPKGWHAAET
jgi:glucose-1-phosphate adenylyltransferase